ncbi:hypothetical protein ACEWY4_013117 [Coilia grayii]|uniref:FBA domain-containing protein n=1 Tax=Coilia grayii TaxID=363190 RepID=A0ABD1JVG8_9TELE
MTVELVCGMVVDLVCEGYCPRDLDTQPAVTVEDWYSGRTDCGCKYQLTVCLLDEKKELLQKFEPNIVTVDPSNSSWKRMTHTFSEYGKGLRFISFEHGGHDTRFWKGWYGVRVTDSAIKVHFCSA